MRGIPATARSINVRLSRKVFALSFGMPGRGVGLAVQVKLTWTIRARAVVGSAASRGS